MSHLHSSLYCILMCNMLNNCMQQRRKHSVLMSFDWSSSKLQANYEQYYWENAMFALILP
uniref:Uncharacterized protein n=1 Tax=Anguilla anguilla TaxID=7936 RepID=A0A0E9XLM7_ANGAN